MPSEVVTAEAWIRATLIAATVPAALGGSAPRLYSHVAPQGTAYPFVVWQLQAPGDDLAIVNQHRVWADLVYAVQVVGRIGAWDDATVDLGALSAWADGALHNGSGNYSGGIVYDCTRERPVAFVETDGDIQYRHLGGIYRLHVR